MFFYPIPSLLKNARKKKKASQNRIVFLLTLLNRVNDMQVVPNTLTSTFVTEWIIMWRAHNYKQNIFISTDCSAKKKNNKLLKGWNATAICICVNHDWIHSEWTFRRGVMRGWEVGLLVDSLKAAIMKIFSFPLPHIFQWKVCGIFIKNFFTWFIIAMLWQEILIEHLTSVGSLISYHFYFFHCPKQPFFMQAVPKKGNTNQWFSGHKVTEQHIKQTVVMYLIVILTPRGGI